jgi:hypothetical protein
MTNIVVRRENASGGISGPATNGVHKVPARSMGGALDVFNQK